METLTILSVAYPFAPVGPDAVGGAEQILQAIDRRLVEHGHHSIVIASEGSAVAGDLIAMPAPRDELALESVGHALVTRQYRQAEALVLSQRRVDIVHLHGLDFDQLLPPAGVPALATVHLPPELLTSKIDRITRPDTWVHGVSRSQHARLGSSPRLLPPIENGVPIDELARTTKRRNFALVLGRVCPEKGLHFALDAAHRARTPVVVGGKVFPYPDHQRYFERELLPRLTRDCRFLGPLSMTRKRRLLNAARCVLLPSQAWETSSLVAMEAIACGTPVIAFAVGALPDIVEPGVTGFIVNNVDEMADAIAQVDRIDRSACREVARARFSVDRMFARYLERYRQILSWSPSTTLLPARSA